jgi:uncharacterized protein YoxC
MYAIEKMKPGILIGEECKLYGGIRYTRKELDLITEALSLTRTYETEVIIENVEERKEGDKVRSWARQHLRKICAQTLVGLVCPQENDHKLETTIKEIQEAVDSFNHNSRTCNIRARYVQFRIEEDNKEMISVLTEQVASIISRVLETLDKDDQRLLFSTNKKYLHGFSVRDILNLEDKSQKDAIIARAKAEKIREALKEIKHFDKLMPKNASDSIQEFVTSSRKIARDLCNRVEKQHKDIEKVLSEVNTSGIKKVRAYFVSALVNNEEEKGLLQ